MEPLRYKPVAYWMLDDATPFVDYSGYNNSGTLAGVEKKGIPVVANAAYSQILQADTTATFASPIYIAGKESEPFTIIATLYPVIRTTTSEIQVLSNQSRYDGLTLNGTIVSFSTKYVSSGEAKCSYDLQNIRKADIVAVHTSKKNSLFVDGILVAEVDITIAQQSDIYDAPNSNLYAGGSAGAQGVMINGIGLYNKALQPEDINRIYMMNNRRSAGDVPKQFGGESFYISSVVRKPYLSYEFSSDVDWLSGVRTSCSVENSILVADMYSGLTIAGQWNKSVDLYVEGSPLLLNSVSMDWYGENVTVEASVDNATWETVQRGKNLTSVPTGFDPTNKALYVRITFDVASFAYIDNLKIKGYLTASPETVDGRTITYTNPITVLDEYNPIELNDNWGTKIINGGTLTIGADASGEPMTVKTVEVWLKRTGTNAPTFSTNLSTAGTYYSNAVAGQVANQGEWVLRHFINPANITGSLVFGGDVQIGRVAFYPTALSASEISAIYTNYTGIQKFVVDDGGDIQLSEPLSPVNIYAHDWEIVAG